MSNKLSNFPNSQIPDVDSGEMALAISEQLELTKWEHIDITRRSKYGIALKRYFNWCVEEDHDHC